MPKQLAHFFHRQFRKNEVAMHELTYLFWECTRRCNLACLHCGSDCSADAVVPDLPFEDFLRAILPIKTAYPANRITVVITGGEPLLRPDLADCGRTLRKKGFRWGIVTNGYAYTEARHEELLSAGMGAITVSLDGLEASHAWLRGNERSFKNAVRALTLISASTRLIYDVVTCVNRRNLAELPRLKALLISLHVRAWRLFTIAPIGRAAAESDTRLTAEEARRLMDFIAASREDTRITVQFSCEAYTGAYEDKVRDGYFFCRAGINIASILIDGSISACPNIDRHFVQGNIYRDDFQDVWETRFKVMRDRGWTRTGLCATCSAYKACEGGAMHLWDATQTAVLACLYREMCG
jgi:radical SAM enzyme (rSAM/lipoprotein system)